jgi:hypothetical protein
MDLDAPMKDRALPALMQRHRAVLRLLRSLRTCMNAPIADGTTPVRNMIRELCSSGVPPYSATEGVGRGISR